MNTVTTRTKGKFAEDLACEYLKGKGFVIIQRNYYTRYGEIDIVFEENGQLIFCEVKAKYQERFGMPEEEFHEKKYEKFHSAVISYLIQNKISNDEYRIDLIALQLNEVTRICNVRHYRGYY